MPIHINNPTLLFSANGVYIRNTDTHEEYNVMYSTISVAYHSEDTIYIYSKLGLNLHLFFEDTHSYTLLRRQLNTKPYYRPSEQTSAQGPVSIY